MVGAWTGEKLADGTQVVKVRRWHHPALVFAGLRRFVHEIQTGDSSWVY